MNSTPTDHTRLIDACKKGDQQAQYALYKLYAKPMYNVALRILQNREEAEDVLQECFIDMFNKLDSWRAEASFGSWFKRIIVNRSINVVKKKKMVLVDIEDHGEKQQEEEEPAKEIPFTVDQIKNALNKLPEGYRIVFSLYLFEDFSHKEIAEQMNITESTSKSQLNRAKKKIRELLENEIK